MLKTKLKSKFTKHMRWTVLLSVGVFASVINGRVCFAQDMQIQPQRPSIPINPEPEQNAQRNSLINQVHNTLCQQHGITDLQSERCGRYAERAEAIGNYLHNAPEQMRQQYRENPTFQAAFLRRVNPQPATANSQLYAPSAESLNAATRGAQVVARNATRANRSGGTTTMTDAEAERIAREAQANADRALSGQNRRSGSPSSSSVARAERDAERATRDANRAIRAINNPASDRAIRRAEQNAERALRNAERAKDRAIQGLDREFDHLTAGLGNQRSATEEYREERASNDTQTPSQGSVPVN